MYGNLWLWVKPQHFSTLENLTSLLRVSFLLFSRECRFSDRHKLTVSFGRMGLVDPKVLVVSKVFSRLVYEVPQKLDVSQRRIWSDGELPLVALYICL